MNEGIKKVIEETKDGLATFNVSLTREQVAEIQKELSGVVNETFSKIDEITSTQLHTLI